MLQPSLFDTGVASATYRRLDTPDADLRLYERAFSRAESDRCFASLQAQTPWRYDQILIRGKRIPLPRLQAWYADEGITLNYSGMQIPALPMTPLLHAIRQRIRTLADLEFNSVLVTLYRDGNDSVGWHSDDEPEFGLDPVIASVSFGATRDFILRHRRRRDLLPVKCALTHGSLLVMGSGSQTEWAHTLPKRKRVEDSRINLTLRTSTPV